MEARDLFIAILCIMGGVLGGVLDNSLSKFEQIISYSELEYKWDDIEFPHIKDFRRRRKPFTINVEGIIGTGKSTFLKSFEAYPLVNVLPEPVDKWTNLNGTDLLQLIYNDPQRWGLAQESFVQLTMMQGHLKNYGAIKVMERSFQSARFIFIENLFRSGRLQPVEYNILNKWYELFEQMDEIDIRTDLTVYLQSNPEVVWERIKRRGRKEEANISKDFLWNIHRLHEDWLVHKNTSFPLPSDRVITIDTSKPFGTMKRIYKSLANKIWSLVPDKIKADPRYRCILH
eukprot:maker-scaffold49_size462716-snap-gene-1.18 protein:Tk03612 transcript:maker-scaffold49_size462716-snap-gene-1.18-mRNA-1 annotation:"thymidine kinase mitochondrial precursor"